jgi:hypothetical protein
MEQAGAIIIVFGLLLVGRGLLDMLRSDKLAAANQRRRQSTGQRWFERPKTFEELRRPPPIHAITVNRQGRRVLWFGGATIVLGIAVLALS